MTRTPLSGGQVCPILGVWARAGAYGNARRCLQPELAAWASPLPGEVRAFRARPGGGARLARGGAKGGGSGCYIKPGGRFNFGLGLIYLRSAWTAEAGGGGGCGCRRRWLKKGGEGGGGGGGEGWERPGFRAQAGAAELS